MHINLLLVRSNQPCGRRRFFMSQRKKLRKDSPLNLVNRPNANYCVVQNHVPCIVADGGGVGLGSNPKKLAFFPLYLLCLVLLYANYYDR